MSNPNSKINNVFVSIGTIEIIYSIYWTNSLAYIDIAN